MQCSGGDAQTASGVAIRTSQGHPGNVPMPPMQDKFSLLGRKRSLAESALARRGASGCGTRGRGNQPTAPPHSRPPALESAIERGNPVVKSQCKRGASARSGTDESALCNARGHADATSRTRRRLDCQNTLIYDSRLICISRDHPGAITRENYIK